MEVNYEQVLVVKPRRSWLGQDDKTKSDKKPEEETQGVWELRVNEHQRKCMKMSDEDESLISYHNRLIHLIYTILCTTFS